MNFVSQNTERKEPIMYAAIHQYYIVPGTTDELMWRLQDGLVPMLSKEPGFIAYYALQVRDDMLISVSIFDSLARAEQPPIEVIDWEQQNLAPFIQCLPEVKIGEVRIHETRCTRQSRGERFVLVAEREGEPTIVRFGV
jgi:hypothetical protein